MSVRFAERHDSQPSTHSGRSGQTVVSSKEEAAEGRAMLMLYAIAAPLWLLSILVGLALFASSRTRRLAPFVILMPTLGYWLSLVAVFAVLTLYQPLTEAAGLRPGDMVFAVVFVGAAAVAGLAGMAIGGVLALRFGRARKVR